MITVEEHNFSRCCVGLGKVRLRLELVWLRDARRQIQRYEKSERDLGGEETGGDAGGIFGAGHGDYELRVRRRVCVVSDRMDVDGIGGLTPCLHLLGYFLGVRGGEDTDFLDGAQRVIRGGVLAGGSRRQRDRQGRGHGDPVRGSGLGRQIKNFPGRVYKNEPKQYPTIVLL
jgi:hypothetical protein